MKAKVYEPVQVVHNSSIGDSEHSARSWCHFQTWQPESLSEIYVRNPVDESFDLATDH